MPNMEELISRKLRKISEKEGEILTIKRDFDYASGQIKLDEQTPNLCILRSNVGNSLGITVF